MAHYAAVVCGKPTAAQVSHESPQFKESEDSLCSKESTECPFLESDESKP